MGIALFTMTVKLLKILYPTVSVCTGQLYNNVESVNLCLWSPNAGLIGGLIVVICLSWLFRGIALFTMTVKLLKVLSPRVGCSGGLL